MPISASVAHTATDALNAKLSLLYVGYEPIARNGDIYKSALYKIAEHLSKSKVKQKKESSSGKNSEKEESVAPLERKLKKSSAANCHERIQFSKHVVKRQCPLVNAGYAARMAITTCAVDQFLSFNAQSYQIQNRQIEGKTKENINTKINVILLGGGMDVLGIWASSICEQFRQEKEIDFSVHIYDLDCEKNCQLKQETLVKSGFWIPHKPPQKNNTENSSLCAEGFVDLTMFSENHDKNNEQYGHTNTLDQDNLIEQKDNYSLISVDLKDISMLDRALDMHAKIDWKKPTIVVSELVLAYLGKNAAKEIMKFFSSKIVNICSSTFVAYEPMGSLDDSKDFSSNEQNEYVSDYCARFAEKMNRGLHSRTNYSKMCFEPLGPNCTSIQKRFQHYWKDSLSEAIAIPASKAITIPQCSACLRSCPEIFDEHAAFLMHLNSYALIIFYSAPNIVSFDRNEIYSSVIPQGWQSMRQQLRVELNKSEPSTEVKIATPTKQSYDQKVANLFQSIYSPYFDRYPEVKKMTKKVLKTDLCFKPCNKGEKKLADGRETNDSLIRTRYRNMGGDFWIGYMDSSRKSDTLPNPEENLRVVACLGMRECNQTKTEGTLRHSKTHTIFEMYRLVVHPSYRCQRIGSKLLEQAESFCINSLRSRHHRIRIVADTIAELYAANYFYVSNGFTLVEQNVIGRISLNTYKKDI